MTQKIRLLVALLVISACDADSGMTGRSAQPSRVTGNPTTGALWIVDGEEIKTVDDGVGALIKFYDPAPQPLNTMPPRNQPMTPPNKSILTVCSSSEIPGRIKENGRCLLTAAHCVQEEWGTLTRDFFYRQHYYARFIDGKGDNLDEIQKGHVNRSIRVKPHPYYRLSVQQVTSEPYSNMDLALVWQRPYACKLEKGRDWGHKCEEKDPNAVKIQWHPLVLAFDRTKEGQLLDHVGYGRSRIDDDDFSTSGIKRRGQTILKDVYESDVGLGAFYIYGTIEGKSQIVEKGDSGSPILVNRKVVGVVSARHEAGERGTALFPFLNHQFVANERVFEPANQKWHWGEAAKFCRPKPLLSLDVQVFAEGSDSAQVVTDFNRGNIDVEIIDPVEEYEKRAGTCDKTEEPTQLCLVDSVVEEITLKAKPKNNFRFIRWVSRIPGAELCPCGNSTSTECRINTNNISWRQENEGIQCAAQFDIASSPPGSCDIPSLSGTRCGLQD
ncbi:MAG: hypothetical protein RIQ81_2467 [Pseudomonadota bacterium]|jgi:hypothetical protein